MWSDSMLLRTCDIYQCLAGPKIILTMQSTERTKDLKLRLSRAILQEAGSYRPAVRPQRRREVVQELVAALPNALQLLASLLQQSSGKPHCLAILPHCLACTLRHSPTLL